MMTGEVSMWHLLPLSSGPFLLPLTLPSGTLLRYTEFLANGTVQEVECCGKCSTSNARFRLRRLGFFLSVCAPFVR